jgi:hypothetical protein
MFFLLRMLRLRSQNCGNKALLLLVLKFAPERALTAHETRHTIVEHDLFVPMNLKLNKHHRSAPQTSVQ